MQQTVGNIASQLDRIEQKLDALIAALAQEQQEDEERDDGVTSLDGGPVYQPRDTGGSL